MASPPPTPTQTKTQPLHNFELPELKWNKDGQPSVLKKRRRSIKAPSQRLNCSTSPLHVHVDSSIKQSTPINGESPNRQEQKSSDSEKLSLLWKEAKRNRDECGALKKGNKSAFIEYHRRNHRSLMNKKATEDEEARNKINPKVLLVKIPSKNNVNKEDADQENAVNNNDFDDETKIWDLRPRKPKSKPKKQVITLIVEKKKADQTANKHSNGEKKNETKKKGICITLTKEEIEEDIFALTGSKPARRPKKRAKNVQKQVDFVFPGLWLGSVTPESYKVSESSMKG